MWCSGVEMTTAGLEEVVATSLSHLNERQKRVGVGAMSEALGRGGQTRVLEASKMSSTRVSTSVRRLRAGTMPAVRPRGPGGGAKPEIELQPGLLEAPDGPNPTLPTTDTAIEPPLTHPNPAT